MVALPPRAKPSQAALAISLGISPSEVNAGLKRLRSCHLARLDIETGKPQIIRSALLEFLKHGLRYVFPAQFGDSGRGLATAWGAPPLQTKIVDSAELLPVWADAEGDIVGRTLSPLHPAAPIAARADPQLYELLAITDALRIGQARERKLAIQVLEKKLR